MSNSGRRTTTQAGVPFLYRQVAEGITAKVSAGEFRGGYFLPSEKVLCATFSASRITVRQALRELERDGVVIPSHGKGWQVVQRETGPDSVSNPVRAGGGKPVLLVCRADDFIGDFEHGLRGALKTMGMELRLHLVNGEDEAHWRELHAADWQAVVYHSSRPRGAVADTWLAQAELPVVLTYPSCSPVPYDAVQVDYACGAEAMVAELTAAGHRRILFVGTDDIASFRLRHAGYERGMRAAGLTPAFLECIYNSVTWPETEAAFLALVRGRDSRHSWCVDAIVGAHARLVEQVLGILLREGGRAPTDLSIVSLTEDVDAGMLRAVGLKSCATVEENWRDVGAATAGVVLSRLNGIRTPPTLTLIQPRCQAGDSVALRPA